MASRSNPTRPAVGAPPRPVRWPAILAATLLVFGLGYSVGKYGIPPRQPAVTMPGGAGAVVDLGNFWQTKKLIEQRYVSQPDAQALITSATKGLVAGLGDPYSDYLTKEEATALDQSLAGTVEGIGIEIGERDGRIQVIAPVPDSPAAKAGIVAGDVITAVEGQSTEGKSVDEIAKLIRGPKGTPVKVEVQTGEAAPRPLEITRQTIKSPSVSVAYRGDVAVITLSRFSDDTAADLDKLVPEIKAVGSRGIVLDLRNNPGGFLDAAVTITSRFQREGVVVKEKYRGSEESESVDGNAPLADLPLVVLINQGSASAAEITAGSLRDNRQVPLVGEQTFGKGSVQELEELGDGAVLKLTIAEWLTPAGVSLSKEGLKPDVTVGSDQPEAQLRAAIDRLRR